MILHAVRQNREKFIIFPVPSENREDRRHPVARLYPHQSPARLPGDGAVPCGRPLCACASSGSPPPPRRNRRCRPPSGTLVRIPTEPAMRASSAIVSRSSSFIDPHRFSTAIVYQTPSSIKRHHRSIAIVHPTPSSVKRHHRSNAIIDQSPSSVHLQRLSAAIICPPPSSINHHDLSNAIIDQMPSSIVSSIHRHRASAAIPSGPPPARSRAFRQQLRRQIRQNFRTFASWS